MDFSLVNLISEEIREFEAMTEKLREIKWEAEQLAMIKFATIIRNYFILESARDYEAFLGIMLTPSNCSYFLTHRDSYPSLAGFDPIAESDDFGIDNQVSPQEELSR